MAQGSVSFRGHSRHQGCISRASRYVPWLWVHVLMAFVGLCSAHCSCVWPSLSTCHSTPHHVPCYPSEPTHDLQCLFHTPTMSLIAHPIHPFAKPSGTSCATSRSVPAFEW